MLTRVVILAAGKGKRMQSKLPKVLHRLGDKTLLEHVVETASRFDAIKKPIVVCGYQAELVQQTLRHLNVEWVEQTQQLGTGHALSKALPHLSEEVRVLVLYGDIPLTSSETLQQFMQNTPDNVLGIITTKLPNPMGYGGRILRDAKNNIVDVVEEKDATAEQLALSEVNSGFYLAPTKFLQRLLPKLTNNNSQQEYYLTDIIHLAQQEGISILATHPQNYQEILGVNDLEQFKHLENFYLQKNK